MRKTVITLISVWLVFVDGWGPVLAGLILLTVHWDFLSELADSVTVERLSRRAIQRLQVDYHAPADCRLVLAGRNRAGRPW